jgi:hypothetical protein
MMANGLLIGRKVGHLFHLFPSTNTIAVGGHPNPVFINQKYLQYLDLQIFVFEFYKMV